MANCTEYDLRKWHLASIRLLLLVLLALLTLVLPRCGKGKKAGTDEIRVGVVLPISGREAKPGQYQREGIELAIHQINQSGGILVKERGKKLSVKEVFCCYYYFQPGLSIYFRDS